MATPHVFVSSTYYDLKHIRASLWHSIKSLGLEPVEAERGNVLFEPSIPLDDSCCAEVRRCQILLLIIGGRSGQPAHDSGHPTDFYEPYVSVTRREFQTAVECRIPVYVAIDSAIHAVYEHVWRSNHGKQDVAYERVESAEVFRFIDEILVCNPYIPMVPFIYASEIESWLRSQWAALFCEYLVKAREPQHGPQPDEVLIRMQKTNQCHRNLLEHILRRVAPKDAKRIITQENQALEREIESGLLQDNYTVTYLHDACGYEMTEIRNALCNALDYVGFVSQLAGAIRDGNHAALLHRLILARPLLWNSLNQAREILRKKPFARDRDH
jgi:hypothetical protein